MQRPDRVDVQSSRIEHYIPEGAHRVIALLGCDTSDSVSISDANHLGDHVRSGNLVPLHVQGPGYDDDGLVGRGIVLWNC